MRKFAVVTQRTLQIWAALAALLFLVWGLVYLYLGRWTVTHQDYWWFYDFYLNHSWLESALLKDDNSFFFPTFLWLANLRFFHGYQLPLFLTGLVLLFITAALLLMPVWRDEGIGLTAKILSTLVIIVGNFWMARAPITASGGLNCRCSLVMAAAVLAFLVLRVMRAGSPKMWPAALMVAVGAAFVASFSFGTGLAIWPTLLLLAWSLRLPKYCVGLLAVAGLVAAGIFILLPSGPDQSLPSITYIAVAWLCRLIGSPFSYAVFAWWPDKLSRQLVESSGLTECAGAAGLMLAAFVVMPPIIRRNVQKSGLEFTGLALTVFSLFALLLVTVGRSGYLFWTPFAQRYLFWSTLFWTGLLLVAIARAQSRLWLRWPVYLVVLAVPVLAFPKHYKDGLLWRNTRWRAEAAAICLVNGVRDEQMTRILLPLDPDQLDRVALQLRARRLDMFADGLQDWIGLNEANLFGGRHKPEGLTGRCRVSVLAQCDNGAPAARVVGQASKKGDSTPKTLVIVDPTGVVRGVARYSASISPFINRLFYPGRITDYGFLGYIRDYDPQLEYAVRSANDGVLSEEKIPVQLPVTEPAKP